MKPLLTSAFVAAAAFGGLFSCISSVSAQQWVVQRCAPVANWAGVASSDDGTKLVAVAGGGGIYISSDSGIHWSLTSAPVNNWSCVASSTDGANLVAAAAVGGIYTSSDSGTNWTMTSASLTSSWAAIASSADGTKLVAVGGISDGIYTSSDSGATWTEQASTYETANWSAVASSADGTHLVASTLLTGGIGIIEDDEDIGNNLNAVFVSSDSGLTWPASSETITGGFTSIASSADGTKIVASPARGCILVSADSGEDWNVCNTPIALWSAVACSADGAKLLAAGPGVFLEPSALITSSDSGASWTQLDTPWENWTGVASSAGGTKLVAVASQGVICTLNTMIPSGSLQVTITPAKALAAGAQWAVDGGAPNGSGATLNLLQGEHTISFTPVPGWSPPADSPVIIEGGMTNNVGGVYKILPAETAVLTVQINGRGSVSPDYNGAALRLGHDYSVTATAGSGFKFLNWMAAGSAGTNATLPFQMASNLQLTATFLDVQPPSVVITTRTGAGSNLISAISGTAHDNVGVAAVWCQVGNGGWTPATTANQYTNWTANLMLSEGRNIIQAYAEDAVGNRSATNSVTLEETSGGFAPESITGTILQLASSNDTILMSFGGSTFSRVNGGVGTYTYTLQDPNTGFLAAVFTAPPTTVSNDSDVVSLLLSFTNGSSGIWGDQNSNSGSFTLSEASSTAPVSLSGLTLQGTNGTTNLYQFANGYGDGIFTATDTFGDSSGTYTFAQYSPVAGLVQAIVTDGVEVNTTNYMLLNFLTGSNSYFAESDTMAGATVDAGTFSVTGTPATQDYTGPVTLAGLTGAVTEVRSNGQRESFAISFNASTVGSFSAADNVDSGVGTYTFTRTGPNTALYQPLALAHSPQADTNGLTLFSFTAAHSATFTNAGAHGTISLSETANLVPLSLAGRRIDFQDGKTYSFGYGTFTNNAGGSGTCTYAPYGPQMAILVLNFYDAQDPATVNFMELWFSTAQGGTARLTDGSGNSLKTGTFTLR